MTPINTGDPVNLAVICLSVGITYYVLYAFYQLFLSPMRVHPGPLLWKISLIPRAYYLMRGELPFRIAKLHEKYGPTVRIAPNEVSFCDADAWKEIYGHRSAGEEEYSKWIPFYKPVSSQAHSVINSNRETHSVLRRQLANGFSDRSMRAQEPIIGSYVNLLIRRLGEECEKGAGSAVVNMRNWFDFTTFDIIGELGMGDSFHGLENSGYHPWVALINNTVKHTAMLSTAVRFGFAWLVQFLFTHGILSQAEHAQIVRGKLSQRLELKAERPDLIEGLVRRKTELGLSFDELAANTDLLIIAGSETTSTLLGGVTYLLATHPDQYARVTREVRSAFADDSEITLTSVSNLSYMLACLNEALRHYPPVVTGLPRMVPKGGRYIAGKFVPENTIVGVWQYVINHDPRYWKDPHEFRPERWTGEDERFKTDRTDAMQPFSLGPRNCIGKNLAYAEMRLILAKLLFNFDVALDPSSRDWLSSQKAYVVWDKPQLNVKLTPVVR
ncbi:P450 monooxygenase No.1 [Biscogniauxia sp. FL1348]|nr:P450 monooxygenase No.1 [Biscogniauxia sp. FL1348]